MKALVFLAAVPALMVAGAQAAHDELRDEMTVYGRPLSPYTLQPQWSALAETNTALLLRRIAGANVNFNGTLAGIAQYRGMFGPRVNVNIDGINIGNACSNNMDAPLHYMPRAFVESVEVIRGIAPVSSGLETIGGTVVADSRLSRFTDGDAFELHGNVNAGGQSVDDGFAASGLVSVANSRHRLHVGANREEGDDREFGDGTIVPTSYERTAFDTGYGFRGGAHELAFDYRRNDTGPTGTPALPMDDIYSDANLFRSRYDGRIGAVDMLGKLYYTDIDHRMSNYELRAAMPGRRRFTLASSNALGYQAEAMVALAGGNLKLGADGHLLDYRADIGDPDNPMFFLRNFNDLERDRYGAYAEWTAPSTGRIGGLIGLRWTHVAMDAGRVDASMAMMMPALATLRDRFNASDRSVDDDNIDAVAIAEYRFSDATTLELGVAHKTRSPANQERYLWSPLEATGGLSDGNLYVGDVDLDPEHAWQLELGLDWRAKRVYLTPRAFYHHVDDYIQGVPATDPIEVMVATMNGDATPLKYANVDARLWGVDANWGVQLTDAWFIDGVVSWVRGERRDIDDDLFRIAPLNALVDLGYRRPRWSATAEGVFYAPQNDVSATNGERASDGYALLNLYAQYLLPDLGLSVSAGIENVLDRTYRPHLNGINRVLASDVAPGTRLPGDGVNAFVQVAWRY